MIKIGITHGDINGISYEIIYKALSDARVLELFTPVIYGSSKVAAYHRKMMDLPSVNLYTIERAENAVSNRVNMINCINDDIKVDFGIITSESGNSAFISLERAVKDFREGTIDALLTTPAIFSEIQKNNLKFSDHTEFLEIQFEKKGQSLPILIKDHLRIALATGNIPFTDVSSHLSSDLIYKKLISFQASLIRDFAITTPRIAVLSLNPNSRSGAFGKEEKEIIIPAIEKAAKEKVYAFGPYASNDFFGLGNFTKFDGILAMYYDQGIIPFKTLSMEDGICFTAGLPIIRTTPNHGPSYEIAGQNTASESAFLHAAYLAIDIYNNRKTDDEIKANPLRKQYFERGSDNEKLDLTSDGD